MHWFFGSLRAVLPAACGEHSGCLCVQERRWCILNIGDTGGGLLLTQTGLGDSPWSLITDDFRCCLLQPLGAKGIEDVLRAAIHEILIRLLIMFKQPIFHVMFLVFQLVIAGQRRHKESGRRPACGRLGLHSRWGWGGVQVVITTVLVAVITFVLLLLAHWQPPGVHIVG